MAKLRNPGALRDVVSWQQRRSTPDGRGGVSRSYSALGTVRCSSRQKQIQVVSTGIHSEGQTISVNGIEILQRTVHGLRPGACRGDIVESGGSGRRYTVEVRAVRAVDHLRRWQLVTAVETQAGSPIS